MDGGRARDSAYDRLRSFLPSVNVLVSTRNAQRRLRRSVCLNITPLSKLLTAGSRSSERAHTSALTEAAQISLFEVTPLGKLLTAGARSSERKTHHTFGTMTLLR